MNILYKYLFRGFAVVATFVLALLLVSSPRTVQAATADGTWENFGNSAAAPPGATQSIPSVDNAGALSQTQSQFGTTGFKASFPDSAPYSFVLVVLTDENGNGLALLSSVCATSDSCVIQATSAMQGFSGGKLDIKSGSKPGLLGGAIAATDSNNDQISTIGRSDGFQAVLVSIDGNVAGDSSTGIASIQRQEPKTPKVSVFGNAGLLGSTGTSMALVLVLGVFALTLVAGARTATRKS